MSDDALTAAIRAVLAASPFHGEGHRKVWARLRHCTIRTSLRRVLRLMRENDLLAPGRVGSPRGPRNHDGTIIPETVDTMWGTDLTTTVTGEGPAAVFVAVDHCSAECVAVHAHSRATRFEALEPIPRRPAHRRLHEAARLRLPKMRPADGQALHTPQPRACGAALSARLSTTWCVELTWGLFLEHGRNAASQHCLTLGFSGQSLKAIRVGR